MGVGCGRELMECTFAIDGFTAGTVTDAKQSTNKR